MRALDQVPMVRCRLDGVDGDSASVVRYVPLADFELWRHLMQTRHFRQVTVEEVSIWISEQSAWWNSGYAVDVLEPVLRVRYERPSPSGVPVPVERFFPAETYPQAQEALLRHFEGSSRLRALSATAGYFVPSEARVGVGARSTA